MVPLSCLLPSDKGQEDPTSGSLFLFGFEGDDDDGV